jgi:hypothetical protein
MSLMGHSRHFDDVRVTSVLPRRTDIFRAVRHVSKVPSAGIVRVCAIRTKLRDNQDKNRGITSCCRA